MTSSSALQQGQALRWGIVSGGNISNDFCLALRTFKPERHEIVAVATRKLEDAQHFATKFNIKKAYASYAELASDPDIDVVYVGVIHPKHAEVCCLMLDSGKHVLCEKPLTLSAKTTQEVLRKAKEKKLLLCEGYWSRFFPVYDELRKQLASQTIGDVQAISVDFGFMSFTSKESRTSVKELGAGVVMDIGCYIIQLANLVYNGEKPEHIYAHGFTNERRIDTTASITLCYKGNRICQGLISSTCNLSRRAMIYGPKGSIEIPNFWCPTEIKTSDGVLKFELPKTFEPSFYINSAGFSYEIEAVRSCLEKGLTEVPQVTHAESLQIAEIQDTILEQLGATY